jgi:thioredoxin reductase (NADPH)
VTSLSRDPIMSTIEQRRDQMFPKLLPEEIERLRRFGEVRRFKAGDLLFVTGERSPGMFVLIAGTVAVSSRDGLGHVVPIVEEGQGEFLAEVGQLSGRPAFVDARATANVEALLITPEHLRGVIVAEAELGERIMRALILRRVALIENGVGGPVLIGPALNPDLVRLQDFLARNGYPHQVLDPDEDADARALVDRYAPNPSELPLSVCADGSVLKNPSTSELGRCLGMVACDHPDRIYDVGSSAPDPPVATAVYAASEGLAVIVFDASAFGGQAGASARIENIRRRNGHSRGGHRARMRCFPLLPDLGQWNERQVACSGRRDRRALPAPGYSPSAGIRGSWHLVLGFPD